ncbi:helix-turn-helix domain-containing protein [Flavonifractor plautii]|uniref:helix-turn-helix domain-containing protein n=1 Tax=Flavonifractor plautii TaxID=292800 RepID=UPI00195E9C5E|nr:helix-turn-helix transcriptional regulator [Flavonifractor plautii]MBM6663506.1 helix-turn-helix transcriptional regulator [Flavonifractor plautii]
MKNIGGRMRELREAAGMTQTDVAKLCGSNQTTIAKMETGKARPSVDVLIWWADYFDVSLDYLCCRTDKPQGATYEARPKVKVDNDMKRFIEMCFDPKSPASKQLKKALMNVVEENKE